jgi:hypothetical protein
VFLVVVLAVLYEFYPVQKEEEFNIDPLATAECTMPTAENPFGNLLAGDDPTRAPTCRGPDIDRMALNLFDSNLYHDIDDIFMRNSNPRLFVTQPATSVDDQEVYKKWLFFRQEADK